MLRRRTSPSTASAPKADAVTPTRGRLRSARKDESDSSADVPSLHPFLLLVFLAALLLASRWSVKLNLPVPVSADTHFELFSEERALAHASALEAFGARVVGTPELENAERYVVQAANKLTTEARNTRPDLDVKLIVHRPTGSFRLNFLNHDIANAYTNLTNVAVRLRRRDNNKNEKAVLLNAHFDTTLGSPGGADCASCVGVLLEILRVMIDDKASTPSAGGVVFLLNGGEETFMQAAHGFVAHHPWRSEIGAVINVEATGSSGPDVLFRETGGWPAEVYNKVAKRPIGTATIRDLVRFANLPVDTDFSVFRDPTLQYGNLPGIDLASMLDGFSYHTDRDFVERIEKGSVQVYGENVLAASIAFADELEKRKTNDNDSDNSTRKPTAPGEGGAFYDVFGVVGVVVGTKNVSLVFHLMPLFACLIDIAFSKTKLEKTKSYLSGAKTSLKSIFFTLTVPLTLSAARAVISGRPLVWFGNYWISGVLTVPPALLAGTAPYVAAARNKRNRLKVCVPSPHLENARGAAFVSALLALVCGAFVAALGYVWVFWSLGISAAMKVGSVGSKNKNKWVGALLCLLPGAALSSPVGYVTFLLINEKVGISGSEPWPLGLIVGDLTMGVASGACVVLCCFGLFPFLNCDKKGVRLGWCFVAVTWILCALLVMLKPTYSLQTPKRLGVLHQHFEDSSRSLSAELLVGAFDAVPAANALAPLTRAAAVRPTTREDFASMHPVTQLLGEGVVLPSEPSKVPPWGAEQPKLEVGKLEEFAVRVEEDDVDKDEDTDEDKDEGDETSVAADDAAFVRQSLSTVPENTDTTRVAVVFRTYAPAWSCVRVTGPVTAWSLSQTLPSRGVHFLTGETLENPLWARHAGNGVASETWRFWIDTESAKEIEVTAWALYPGGGSDEIRSVTVGLGKETSPIAGTTFRTKPTRVY